MPEVKMDREQFLLKWEDWGVRPIDNIAFQADLDALLQSEQARIQELEVENGRLKKLVDDLAHKVNEMYAAKGFASPIFPRPEPREGGE
jgi:hypothetical protein